MAYHVDRKRVVLSAAITTPLGDTWEWDGKHWTQRQNMGPAPRMNHPMVSDTDRRRVVLYGGEVGGGSTGRAGDIWEWREWPANRASHE